MLMATEAADPVAIEIDDATRRALPVKPWEYLNREVCVTHDATATQASGFVAVKQPSDILIKESAAAQTFGKDAVSMCDFPVHLPRLLKEVKPSYTAAAMRARIQGSVRMEAVVDADGTVTDVRVTRPLHPELDAEAMKTVRQWVFAPGTLDGKPVRVVVEIEMTFTLRGKR